MDQKTDKPWDLDLVKLFRDAEANMEWHRKTDYFPFIPNHMKYWDKKEKKMYPVEDLQFTGDGNIIIRKGKKVGIVGKNVELIPESPLVMSNGDHAYFGDFVQVSEDTYKMFREVGWKRQAHNPLIYVILYHPELMGWGKTDLWDIWYSGGNPYYAHASYLWLIKGNKEARVVGNMFQNPELLDPKTALTFKKHEE